MRRFTDLDIETGFGHFLDGGLLEAAFGQSKSQHFFGIRFHGMLFFNGVPLAPASRSIRRRT